MELKKLQNTCGLLRALTLNRKKEKKNVWASTKKSTRQKKKCKRNIGEFSCVFELQQLRAQQKSIHFWLKSKSHERNLFSSRWIITRSLFSIYSFNSNDIMTFFHASHPTSGRLWDSWIENRKKSIETSQVSSSDEKKISENPRKTAECWWHLPCVEGNDFDQKRWKISAQAKNKKSHWQRLFLPFSNILRENLSLTLDIAFICFECEILLPDLNIFK